ncbi:MAG: glycerate kinase [Candidatus Dormibacteria bacterium]
MTNSRPIRVLLAPNAFKGTMSAVQACSAMAAGVRQALPLASVVRLPMADGGDGFLATLVAARGGSRSHHLVPSPLLEPIRAPIGWLPGASRPTAVIELAAAGGLARIAHPSPRTAETASTRGLGALIGAALERTPELILVGIGGSASSDGGAGMARALGYRFLKADGAEILEGGIGLLQLHHIDAGQVDPRLAAARVLAACDVTNPLLGPQGAAAVYAPQKGADQLTAARLEAGLQRLAEVAGRDLGTAGLEGRPGSGAAGGAGFGLVAFCGAHLAPGIDLVAEACDLDHQIAGADLVLTGEGSFDLGSLQGKVPGEVARRARLAGVPCLVIAGSSSAEARAALGRLSARLLETGTDVSGLERGDPHETAMIRRRARAAVRRAAVRACAMVAVRGPQADPP